MYTTYEVLEKMEKYFLPFAYIGKSNIIFAQKYTLDSYKITFLDGDKIRSAIYYIEGYDEPELFPTYIINRDENVSVYNKTERLSLFYVCDYAPGYKLGFFLNGNHIERIDIQIGGEWNIDYTNENFELIDEI